MLGSGLPLWCPRRKTAPPLPLPPCTGPCDCPLELQFYDIHFFFQVCFCHFGLTQFSGSGVGSEEFPVRARGESLFLFVTPMNCCPLGHTQYLFFIKHIFSNSSKLPTSLKDMKNGNSRKPQCACLPWLESVSLFGPGWP